MKSKPFHGGQQGLAPRAFIRLTSCRAATVRCSGILDRVHEFLKEDVERRRQFLGGVTLPGARSRLGLAGPENIEVDHSIRPQREGAEVVTPSQFELSVEEVSASRKAHSAKAYASA
jgi:hypothetical protein